MCFIHTKEINLDRFSELIVIKAITPNELKDWINQESGVIENKYVVKVVFYGAIAKESD